MSKKQFKIGTNSRINFELCDDRITLQGSSKGLFSYSSRGDVSVLEEGDLVNVLADYDLKAYVPKQAPVSIQKVEGRVSAKELYSLRIDDSEFEVKVSDVQGALTCLLYTSPSPRDQRGSRMPSSA